jgi:hypothetical protein
VLTEEVLTLLLNGPNVFVDLREVTVQGLQRLELGDCVGGSYEEPFQEFALLLCVGRALASLVGPRLRARDRIFERGDARRQILGGPSRVSMSIDLRRQILQQVVGIPSVVRDVLRGRLNVRERRSGSVPGSRDCCGLGM